MAESKKVQSSDIISDDLFVEQIKNAKLFEAEIDKLVVGLKDAQKVSAAFLKANKDPQKAKEIKAVTDETEKLSKANKAVIALEIEKEKLKQSQLRTEKLISDSIKKAEKEKEKEIATNNKLNSSYLQASKRLNELRLRYKDLAIEGKGATKEAIELLKAVTKLDAELKEADATTGQFNRNVGNYSEGVQDAIEKTGLFGGVISKITYFVELYEASIIAKNAVAEKDIVLTEAETVAHAQNVVALEAETVATEQLTLAKRLLNAVTSPLGIVLLLVGALAALAKATYDVNQATQDWVALQEAKALDATRSKTQGYTTAIYDHTKAVIELRKYTNKYLFDLAELKDLEGDLTEISNDATLSFGQREDAFKKANEARVKLATKELEFAKKELEIANLAVKKAEDDTLVKKGQALNEFYLKQTEAKVKAFEAEDALGDLTRTNAEKERQLIQNKTSFEVDLILKKKENAFAQTAILEQQIKDETDSLKKRRDLINELNKEERKTQEAQFKIFNDGIKKENEVNAKAGEQLKKLVDFKDLINTKDAVALGKKIELLRESNLTDEQSAQVAKIVVNAQNQRIDNQAKLNEQKQKELDLLKKIQEIELQNIQIQKNAELEIIKEIENEKIKIYENANKKILEGERVNQKMALEFRKQSFEEVKRLINLEAQEKQNKLLLEVIEQKTAIDNSNELDVVKTEKKKQIDIKYKIDSNKIERERLATELDLNEKEAENLKAISKRKKEIEIEKTKEIISELQKVTSAVSDQLDKQNDKQNDAKEKEIDKTKTNIERQRELAEKGAANTLAFEESQLAKRELKQKEALERQAKEKELIQLTEAYFNALNARLTEVGGNPDMAPIRALGDVLIAKGVAKGIVQFAKDGNEMVTPSGVGGQDGVDDIPFMLTKGEAVIPKKANIENHDAVKSLINGNFEQLYKPVYENNDTATNIYTSLLLQQNDKIISKLDDLIAKPVQQIDVDSMGNIRESILKQVSKTVIVHKQKTRI